jgi:hypothetical protein
VRTIMEWRGRSETCNSEPLFYNPTVATTSASVGLVLLAASSLLGQNNPLPPGTPAPPEPTYVTCGQKPPLATRTVRSDVFVSPDGKHRTYTEVEAKALYSQRPPGYSGPLCVNNSRLFASEGTDFKIVFLQEPSDQETGNSLRPVDWSADSRRLLLELAEWQYETPGTARSILIYDARNGTFQQPDMMHLFRKQFGIECSLNIHVTGFTGEGKIGFETQPLFPEEEEVLALPSCSRKKETYELDRSSETIIAVPGALKIQRNAKIEPASGK